MTDWKRRAESIARVHSTRDFQTRWGVKELLAENAVYVFNNMPPKGRISARDKQFEEIRRQLAQIGITELGYGEYPETGPDEGYSCVAILQATPDQIPPITRICRDFFGSDIGWEED